MATEFKHGKHTDEMRALDQKSYVSKLQSNWGERRSIVWAEKVIAFDEMAREIAETKSRQNLALMIEIMGRL